MKKTRLRSKSLQVLRDAKNDKSPLRKKDLISPKRNDNIPTKKKALISPNSSVRKNHTRNKPVYREIFNGNQCLSRLSRYDLQHVLRLHGHLDDGTADYEEDYLFPSIYSSKFAPRTPFEIKNNESVYLVATCGSNSVCITDCAQNKVLSKYSHVEEDNEVFTELAWSVINRGLDGANSFSRILAVGGLLGSVKFIDTMQNTCFRKINAHKQQITAMEFLQSRPSWVLTGSNDKTIKLWDIGSLQSNSCDNHLFEPKCLAVFLCDSAVIAIKLMRDEQELVVSDMDGSVFIYDMNKVYNNIERKSQSVSCKKYSPIAEFSGRKWHQSSVDYLDIFNDDIVISKECEQTGLKFWSRKNSSMKKQALVLNIEPPSPDLFFISGKLFGNPKYKKSALILGTECGSIYVYELKTSGKSASSISASKKPHKLVACTQKQNLSSQVPVTDLDVSFDGKYIVVVDEMDCLWIWSNKE